MPMPKRLHNPLPGEGDPTLFEAAPVASSEEIATKGVGIVRRIGSSPSHLNCDCPNSWLKVMIPVTDVSHSEGDKHQEGSLGYAYLSTKTIASSANKRWQERIRVLGDGSGGIADYELLVSANKDWTTRSMHWVMWQSGVRFTQNPFNQESLATQEPIPGLESPPLPLPQDQQRRPDWLSVGGPAA